MDKKGELFFMYGGYAYQKIYEKNNEEILLCLMRKGFFCQY